MKVLSKKYFSKCNYIRKEVSQMEQGGAHSQVRKAEKIPGRRIVWSARKFDGCGGFVTPDAFSRRQGSTTSRRSARSRAGATGAVTLYRRVSGSVAGTRAFPPEQDAFAGKNRPGFSTGSLPVSQGFFNVVFFTSLD